MAENPSANTEKSMTTLSAEDSRKVVRGWLEELAGRRQPEESMKGMLRRVAILAGLPAAHVKRLWYGEIAVIPWHEAEMIRLRAQERKNTQARWRHMQEDAITASLCARAERQDNDNGYQGQDRRCTTADFQSHLGVGSAAS